MRSNSRLKSKPTTSVKMLYSICDLKYFITLVQNLESQHQRIKIRTHYLHPSSQGHRKPFVFI